MAIKWHEQRGKGWNKDESAVLMEMLNVSPPLGIKARKMVNAEKTLNYNKNVIKEMETFDIDNPQWSAVTNYVEATTNVPLNRLYNKTQNVRESLDNQHNALERALMFGGWSKWNLGLGDSEKIEEVKETIKEKKKVIAKEKAKVKKEEKKKQVKEDNKAKIEENKKKSKKDGVCSAIGKAGERCGNKVVSGKSFCTVHEKTTKRADGKETQCKKIKKDGKRCGMQTSNKSGYCYYHD
jgi:outer membrane biosynthesis protein TonB